MTVAELIIELQKLPPNAVVDLMVDPNFGVRRLHSVSWDWPGATTVYLRDKYWTPYAEEDEE